MLLTVEEIYNLVVFCELLFLTEETLVVRGTTLALLCLCLPIMVVARITSQLLLSRGRCCYSPVFISFMETWESLRNMVSVSLDKSNSGRKEIVYRGLAAILSHHCKPSLSAMCSNVVPATLASKVSGVNGSTNASSPAAGSASTPSVCGC